MILTDLDNLVLEETGFGYTMSLIDGKYKLLILYLLANFKVIRFNELKRKIPNISFRSLSLTLKQLEADGLIRRKEYPQIPPKVEYSLSDLGITLLPVLTAICGWGEEHKN